ncbi:MAG: patatin-like phospholipase family protein [Gemmatimonadetes bacterium]|nr:patatin-like phospholipase family protein [Gemmatimonadota bacterium]
MTAAGDTATALAAARAGEAAGGDAGPLAIAMGGGGARAAYQLGLLRCLARRMPALRIPYISGVSAGAINAAHLAAHHGTFAQAVDELSALWSELTPEKVFRADASSLFAQVFRWGLRLMSGGRLRGAQVRSMVDSSPLKEYLEEALAVVDHEIPGIEYNLHRGVLRAIAITTTSYTTAQTITWIQGRDVEEWERPQRKGIRTRITLDHVMASAALPLFFPAIRIGNAYYGDGGLRQSAPLAPAVHLGARRIIAISTRYVRTREEAEMPSVIGYPPPAQVLGVVLNSIFLDMLDQDAFRLERINQMLRKLPDEERNGLHIVDLLVVRPSRDLGRLAADYEPRLPRAFRFLTRGLGTRETKSPDSLSIVMFQRDYLHRLMEIGEEDAERLADDICAFVKGEHPGLIVAR